MKFVTLKVKRDRPTRLGHPWIFSGAIESVSGEPLKGETVIVKDAQGNPLGSGAYSPDSQIRVRMWTQNPDEAIDEAFFRRRLERALAVREGMKEQFKTNALRLVNAEADGLPGITVDCYDRVLVGQFTTAGAEAHKRLVARLLVELTGAASFYERSDVDGRKHEGLEPSVGLLVGEEPPPSVSIVEGDVTYLVNVREGHKTGFYLDQRENRRLLASYAKGRRVLNTFSYTGGFGIAAQVAGAAEVTHVDLSASALACAQENSERNGKQCPVHFLNENVFQVLRTFRDKAQQFDMVILDPPKFAETRSQTMKALRGYKDINLLGLKLVAPGGLFATFSCSGAIDPVLFRKVVTEAAQDAKRKVRILHELRQAPDHVESLQFPEGFYLKGLLCCVE